MEGTFKWWVKGKPYGFIVPDDGSQDVFVHQSSMEDFSSVSAASRVSFEVEITEKGRVAMAVRPIIVSTTDGKRHQGWTKFWSDRGFGFIETEDELPDVYVHVSAISPYREDAYLCEGDLVEFEVAQSDKGFEARKVVVIGWTPRSDEPLARFADMGGASWLKKLLDIQPEDEPWDYKHATRSEPFPILRNYIQHTFRRLEETNGIAFSSNGKYAAFNTGLVTVNQEDVFTQFYPNLQPNRHPWKLMGFRKASDWDFLDQFGGSPPPLANYFDDPKVLLYDRRCELYVGIDHVMSNIDRFPEHLRSKPYVARQLLLSAEATTKKRVYRNYKTAIPQFYRDKGGPGSVQLLLPLCLENPARADLALVVERSESANAYRGNTVLSLDMAYNNARLLARPDTEWLQP